MTQKIDKETIESFIRAGTSQGLSDREMAAQLTVAMSTIRKWRKQFGIPPSEKFRRRFTAKYGADALERFRAMVERKATLREIACSFGFSYEYARQVYLKLYGAGRRNAPRA